MYSDLCADWSELCGESNWVKEKCPKTCAICESGISINVIMSNFLDLDQKFSNYCDLHMYF